MMTPVADIPMKIYDEENRANRVYVVNEIQSSGVGKDGLPFAAWRSEKGFGQVLMQIGNKIRSVRVRGPV